MCEMVDRGDEAHIHCGEAPLAVGLLGVLFHPVGDASSPFISMRIGLRTHMLRGSVWSQRNLNSQERWAKLSTMKLAEIKDTLS